MSLADGRRRMLERDGRPMILRRITNSAPVSVTLMGKHTAYLPQELTGAVRQGDVRIAVGQDEIAAAGWPTPIRSPDEISIDGQTFTVQGAVPVYEGTTLIGWKIHARGGR
jgi:hypothetical protein